MGAGQNRTIGETRMPDVPRERRLRGRAPAALVVGVAVAPVLVVALVATSDPGELGALVVAAIVGTTLAFAAVESLVVGPSQRMAAALEAALEAGSVEAEQAGAEHTRLVGALIDAGEHERERIAGDVHDDTMQTLVAVGMHLHLLRSRIDDPAQHALLTELELALEATIHRTRALLFELRPPALADGGLRNALEVLLGETFAGDTADWDLVTRYAAEPPDATRVVVYRIAQEALGNALRHARAGHVEVVIEARDGGIVGRITDDGVGFDAVPAGPAPDRPGLTSMRERAVEVGGTFRIDSAPGGGTTVEWWLP